MIWMALKHITPGSTEYTAFPLAWRIFLIFSHKINYLCNRLKRYRFYRKKSKGLAVKILKYEHQVRKNAHPETQHHQHRKQDFLWTTTMSRFPAKLLKINRNDHPKIKKYAGSGR